MATGDMSMEYEFADTDETFGLRIAHDSYDATFWREPKPDVGHVFHDANRRHQFSPAAPILAVDVTSRTSGSPGILGFA